MHLSYRSWEARCHCARQFSFRWGYSSWSIDGHQLDVLTCPSFRDLGGAWSGGEIACLCLMLSYFSHIYVYIHIYIYMYHIYSFAIGSHFVAQVDLELIMSPQAILNLWAVLLSHLPELYDALYKEWIPSVGAHSLLTPRTLISSKKKLSLSIITFRS